MTDQSFELCGSCCWWLCSPDQMGFISYLDTKLQLVVQRVCKTKSISLIRLEHPSWPSLDMHRIDREIAFLQVLLERKVVVSCFFHQDEAVLKRRKALYPLYEGAETLSRVLEGKRWTRLKALMAL